MSARARGRCRGQKNDPEGARTPHVAARPSESGDANDGARALSSSFADISIRSGGGDSRPTGTRGKRRTDVDPIQDTIRTKPQDLTTKKGITGVKHILHANYFMLETQTDWSLYQYRVDFAPEEDRTPVKKSLLRPHRDVFGGAYIFDGTVLYTSTRLSRHPMELYSLRESDRKKIRITVKYVGDVVTGDYQYLQVFNIIMRKCLDNLHLQMVGRNFFDPKAKIKIHEHSLELWPGYLTSIRQCETSILMCAEISYKVMRCDTALDLYQRCFNSRNKDWKIVFENTIIGSIILTDYNNRTYRIDDVDYKVCPSSKFKIKNGDETSYLDYYKNKYGIVISVSNQPMLVSKAKPREIRAGMTEIIYLIPELCRLTGLEDEMRSNFQLMRALAEYTRVSPKSRIEKLNKFNKRLKDNENVVRDLASWNMRLSDNIVQFEGRILPSEKIIFGNNMSVEAGREADWTRSMRNKTMLFVPQLKTWALVYLGKNKAEVTGFLGNLVRSAKSINFNIPEPYLIEVKSDKNACYVDVLDTVISQRNPQIILCVVPNNKADRYAAIKKKCCIDRAVPTQVVVARNFTSKNVMAIATKIAIQMNCKLGGIPWTVHVPLKGLMIVGYDVCHDGAHKERSYGAMVATLNGTLSRYYSAVTNHTFGEELSNDLSLNIVKSIIKYREYNQGAQPSTIIIYRDGVGEGQIPFVYNHEVKTIKDRLKELYPDDPPRLGVVIVTKRLNTRIFLNAENPPPGTIADDVITSSERYDFFLVSQSVRQGTVSPTAYNVIDDSTRLDADKIQRLSFKLTHLYFNWSGTVRVPAPCQYAHKLAFLVSQFLHRTPNTDLEDILYFL